MNSICSRLVVTSNTVKFIIEGLGVLIGVVCAAQSLHNEEWFTYYIIGLIALVIVLIGYSVLQYIFSWSKASCVPCTENRLLGYAYCERYDLEEVTASVYGDPGVIPIIGSYIFYSDDLRYQYIGVRSLPIITVDEDAGVETIYDVNCISIQWGQHTFLTDCTVRVYSKVLKMCIPFMFITSIIFGTLEAYVLLFLRTYGDMAFTLGLIGIFLAMFPYEVVKRWRYGIYE